MWFSLFILQGFVICAFGYDFCINSILKCSLRQIWFTEGLLWDSFIESPVLLDIKCKGQKKYITCIRDVAKRCRFLNPILEDFIETREFAAHLCETEDEEFRQSYLKSAACINKLKPLTNLRCSHDMLTERIPSSYPLVDYSCRYLKANLKCRQRVFSKQCGNEAGEIFKRVMLHEFNLDILCNNAIQSKDTRLHLKEFISHIIQTTLEFIKPILGLETDVLETEKISDGRSFILRAIIPDHNENQYKGNIQTCEKDNCNPKESSQDLPENLDNHVLEHDGQELRKNYGLETDVLETEQISDVRSFILRTMTPDHNENQYKSNIQTCEKDNCNPKESSQDLPENLDNHVLEHDGQELRKNYGLETDVLETEQISDGRSFILRTMTPDHNENQYKGNIQTCEKDNCNLKESSRDLPGNLDNHLLEHDGQEFRRSGSYFDSNDSLFSDLSAFEIVTSFKFYNKLLIKLSPMLDEMNLELRPQSVRRTSTVFSESCKTGCGASRLRWSSTSFEPEPSETDIEEESDVHEAINDVKSRKAEANSGLKIFPGVHIDPSTIETIDPFKIPLKPLPDKKVNINYILIGHVYTPFEIHYTDGDKKYAHSTNVKITQKKYYLTPSTETVLPSIFADEDIPSTELASEECDFDEQVSKWTLPTNEVPEV